MKPARPEHNSVQPFLFKARCCWPMHKLLHLTVTAFVELLLLDFKHWDRNAVLSLSLGFTSHSTQNRSFRRRSPSQSLGLVWKNPNTSKLHIHNQKKCTTTQKTKARFSHLLWHPAWIWTGSTLVSALHKFVTNLLTYPFTYSPGPPRGFPANLLACTEETKPNATKQTIHTQTHTTAIFRDHPGEPVPEENF